MNLKEELLVELDILRSGDEKLSAEELFDLFVRKECDDFSEYMGYGEKEIREVGVEKFIKAMGWEKASHIKSWRTDKARINICPDCKADFGIFDLDFGICSKCLPKYNRSKLERFVEKKIDSKGPLAYIDTAIMIISDDQFRRSFYR